MNQAIEEVTNDRPSRPARILHILNGDSARGTLEQSGTMGDFSIWADVLHEGPVPGGLSDEEFRQVRSRFHAAQGQGFNFERAYEMGKQWDDKLASFAAYDEVILWFEHDLFDQLILIHLLDFYSRRSMGSTRLSLICIGEFPGVERFVGLGQLTGEQLTSLLGTRQQVTDEQLRLGRLAWSAFTSSDPTMMEKVIQSDTSALPFLAGAFHRFLQEYPSTQNGLPRTERQIMALLVDGPKSPGELFRATYPLEERVFMGDTTFWARVKGLAAGRHPLVDCNVTDREGGWPSVEVRITETGKDVIQGKADWIKLNGIDRWLGGVHLHGDDAKWRWDEQAGKLIQSS